MYLAENLIQKWAPVLNHESLPEIKDPYKRTITAVMLENQEKAIREERAAEQGFLVEAPPTTSMGAGGAGAGSGGGTGGYSGTAAAAGPVAGYDPIMISLVRRAMPQLIAYDICGVQPMTGPTGLIFAMKSTYDTPSSGKEALFDEALVQQSSNSSAGTVADPNLGGGDPFATGGYGNDTPDDTGTGEDETSSGSGMTTQKAETLGDGADNHFREMSFSIEKSAVTAKSRALKAEYTTELAQDLKAVHGLDAETELANILSTEILAEINREIVRMINVNAKLGAQTNTVASAGAGTGGEFDLDKDSNGRWSVEKFKGLLFQIERDANAIAIQTRRGRGNIILTSPDVASALSMAGVLDYNPAIQNSIDSDVTTNSFAGTLNGKYKVYVDPYFVSNTAAQTHEYYTMGYKGASPYDAGVFYCPYIPLQMVKAMGENSFQPKIGFKTRYGIADNPFVTNPAENPYYRKVKVTNLM
jgi:hypothetical protein